MNKHDKKYKYSLSELRKAARSYDQRYKFQKGSPKEYKSAYRRNVLDQICSHMPKDAKIGKPSHNFMWTCELVREIAKNYDVRSDFFRNDGSCYNAARKFGILDEVCSHMPKRVCSGRNNPRFKWTTDKIREVAATQFSVGDFQRNRKGAYLAALRNGILSDVTKSMAKSIRVSKAEANLFHLIKQKYPKTQMLKDAKVSIAGKPHIQGFDIDIYVPELRKGIEFDGTYWHSVPGLKRSRKDWPEEDIENYHFLKDNHFKDKNIKILHIKEEEWIKNREGSIEKCFKFLESE
jgi:hypothetical protein